MTPTPNPTAEQVFEVAMQLAAMTLGQTVSGRLRKSDLAHYLLRNVPLARGLLSEGAPSEEQVERAAQALFAREQYGEWDDFHKITQDRYRDTARAALTAAGVAPQKPQALAPEKVKAWLQREFGSVLAHDPHNPERFWGGSARAFCVAYTEGKLT